MLIPTPDGQADGLIAYPDDNSRHPGILLYADAFGIRPTLRNLAGELASHGYVVLVPNFFYRHGPTPVLELPDFIGEDVRAEIIEKLMPMIGAHTGERTVRDAAAYLEFLAGRAEVVPGPVGVVGYCIGGLLAVRTAVANPDRVAAVAAFHAPVAADGTEAFAELAAKAHFGHAESDLTPSDLTALNDALTAAEVDYTSEIYPGSVHGFTMSDTDAFDSGAYQQHWDRLLPLLTETLGER